VPFFEMLFLRTVQKLGKIVPTESYERRADEYYKQIFNLVPDKEA
jgi:hypothetical protein